MYIYLVVQTCARIQLLGRTATTNRGNTMQEFTFYIPVVRDSDKKPHNENRWSFLEDRMARAFGGYTRKANVTGAWLDDSGKLIRDESRVYSIGVSEDKLVNWQRFSASLAVIFDQQCIYVCESGVASLVG